MKTNKILKSLMMTTVLTLLVIYTLITPVFAAYTQTVSLGNATCGHASHLHRAPGS